jgi:Holliday junction resolvase-like predicted endonuclease
MNSTSHVGAAGELFACSYFLAQGLEVARNIAASGPMDLIVYNKLNGRMVAIDIKSVRSPYVRKDGSYCISHDAKWSPNNIAQCTYVHGEASLRIPEGFWEALGMETAE